MPPHQLRVLLCLTPDDIRGKCAGALRVRGYHVDEVMTGTACVEYALSAKIDAAVIDTDLADIDGFEVARRIRAEDTRHRVKLISSTAVASSSAVARSRSAGFDLLVLKPLRVDQLVIAMETLRSLTPP